MEQSAGLILENSEGKFLFQLRNNIPTIRFPACWSFFGGQLEKDEEPLKAIKREIKEEIGLDIPTVEFWKTFEWTLSSGEKHLEHIFFVKMDLDLKKVIIYEGEKAEFFSKHDIENLKTIPSMKKIMKEYLAQN